MHRQTHIDTHTREVFGCISCVLLTAVWTARIEAKHSLILNYSQAALQTCLDSVVSEHLQHIVGWKCISGRLSLLKKII